MGADIKESGTEVTVIPGRLHAAEIDGENIPDLIPVLSGCRLPRNRKNGDKKHCAAEAKGKRQG